MIATNIEILLDRLASFAAEGGRIAMRHHGKLGAVDRKADATPLTAADLEVDDYLCHALAKEYPTIPIVTEERTSSHVPGHAGGPFFLVDPIDGTREFVAERGEFTVNIALIDQGEAVAGAVCAPAVGRLFVGACGVSAYETAADAGTRKSLVPRRADNERLVVVASRSHLNERTRDFIGANRVAKSVSAGSSLKFCLLAAGEADLYPRFGPTMEWDTAAGHAVLSAAGGFVEDISGAPLKYGKPSYRNGDFIAYTPGTKFQVPVELTNRL